MKKVKILTIILAIILVSMVAFLGVYTKVQNRMENHVKDYSYAMDLDGIRSVRLKVNKETETVIKDKVGNKVNLTEELTEEQMKEKGYTEEEVPYNKEEILTVENYKKSKKIIEERLKKLSVDNYIIKLDESTGDILVELTEDENTDYIVSNLNASGKFEIIDTQTKEVLMTNSDIKLANVMYGSDSTSTTSTGTAVYLNIEFTKDGTKKLEDISNKYVKVEDTTTETETTTEENATETKATEEVEKTITMQVDGEEIMSTSFDEPMRTGKLQLSVGHASNDQEVLQGYIEQASNMATVLDVENMPIKYDVNENEYVASDITKEDIQLIKYIAIAVISIALIALCIRYKTNGFVCAISYVGMFAVLMLLIRYANVVLSIEGLFAIALVLVLEYIFVNKILNKIKQTTIKEAIKESYKEFFVRIIPILIAVITFCFIKWVPISSFGMVMFWGISLIAIYNFVVIGNLLKIKADNK